MNRTRKLRIANLTCSAIFAAGALHATAAENTTHAVDIFGRQVTFEMTFANCDLIWLGDPASPSALVYIAPDAQPIATDVWVTTLSRNTGSPVRRYMDEARIVMDESERQVLAFTREREKMIGTIDDQGRFLPNDFYTHHRELLPSWPADAGTLAYDAEQNALYYEVDVPGPRITESLDFLPWNISGTEGAPLNGQFSIAFTSPSERSSAGSPHISLHFQDGGSRHTIATATLPEVLRRGDVELGSFDNASGTYHSESVYRPGSAGGTPTEPSVTFTFPGKFTAAINNDGPALVLAGAAAADVARQAETSSIAIDGSFDDWCNVAGVDDPRGDLVPYLEYVPDVDLLEFKVAHDDAHIYLYARVAGRVGHSHPDGGRSYFYAYMDVDQNPGTGFLPTRDDDCYFGVEIGDDCEVQFEFVDNRLRKTFYGFCGLGGNDDVLKQVVTLGNSQYGRFDENGHERAHYKAEYIYREGRTEITEDLKLGTSDTIHLAVSPDGHEVEVVSTFTGFLKDASGNPTVALGQTIDLAVGMECDSKAYPGKARWAADSTPAIFGYRLTPSDSHRAARD